ncbi:MAG: methionyl-tRNA formyltransferase [Candidatus Kerfeldbacteria bacterium]|nr:methionyl-tRNA formyltransferase [Candidatus Kerfeldbacteria bacterium]
MKHRILFFGTSEFAVPSLEQLVHAGMNVVGVVTRPAKPVGRKHVLTPTPVGASAQTFGLEVIETEKPTKELLKKFSPDVCVVIAYGKIIPAALLGIPKFGFVNLHPSLLPRWRGPSPLQAAILAGNSQTGVTLMKLDKGVDTGPILEQEEVDILTDDTAETLYDRCAQVGADLLVRALPQYLAGNLLPQPQSGKAMISKMLTREDGRIDWTHDASSIERQIRAFTPWPGAWAMFGDERVKILEARVLKANAQPGEIAFMGDALAVGCGQGALAITKLQREGKKPVSGEEFIRGLHTTDLQFH